MKNVHGADNFSINIKLSTQNNMENFIILYEKVIKGLSFNQYQYKNVMKY